MWESRFGCGSPSEELTKEAFGVECIKTNMRAIAERHKEGVENDILEETNLRGRRK